MMCRTCRGLKWWPRRLPYYRDVPCNDPWHPGWAFRFQLYREKYQRGFRGELTPIPPTDTDSNETQGGK